MTHTMIGTLVAWCLSLLEPATAAAADRCLLPPALASASFDAARARYEWTTTCDEVPVVLHGIYNDRTYRAILIVRFPGRSRPTNRFELRCRRNPWSPGGRLPCTPVRAVVNVPGMLAAPWLGTAELRGPRRAAGGGLNRAAVGSPTPLLPRDRSVLRRPPTGTLVELRWTSSAGPASVYRVEIQRSISHRGPWSLADIAEVPATSDISTGYRVPPRVLGAHAYRHWRWRVGQFADDRSLRYSAWHRFSLK